MYADIILKNQLGALDVICETLHGQNGLKEFQKNAIDAKETVPMIVQVLRRILDKSGVELKSNFVLKSIDWTLPFFPQLPRLHILQMKKMLLQKH